MLASGYDVCISFRSAQPPSALTGLSPTASTDKKQLPYASLPFDAARRARVELSGRLPSRQDPQATASKVGQRRRAHFWARRERSHAQKIGACRFSSMASTCPLTRIGRRGTRRRIGLTTR
jgi:hypothetical protein